MNQVCKVPYNSKCSFCIVIQNSFTFDVSPLRTLVIRIMLGLLTLSCHKSGHTQDAIKENHKMTIIVFYS